jgi:hypothetical protein
VISSIVKKGYLCGFFFYLDVIGTVSLIPDLFELESNLSAMPEVGSTTGEDLAVARAGRAGRIARTAGSVKFTKFARLFRIARMVRVVRLFRLISGKVDRNSDMRNGENRPSKVGMLLSDVITKRIIILVITMIISIPALEYELPAAFDAGVALKMLHQAPSNSSMMTSGVAELTGPTKPVYFLQVRGQIYYEDMKVFGELRNSEIVSQCVPSCASLADTGSVEHLNLTVSLISTKDVSIGRAVNSMIMVLFIIVVFGAGSWIVSRDAHSLVVEPIERMTAIIRKLAGTICILSTEEDEELVGEGYETALLESVVTKMADIFNVSSGGNSGASRSRSKLERMTMGTKNSEIKTRSSIYTIKVSERPNVPSPKPRQFRKKVTSAGAYLKQKLTGTTVRPPIDPSELPYKITSYPELYDFGGMLRNDALAPQIKLFMGKQLTMENFLFWQEVERFKASFTGHTQRVIENYIKVDAMNQVNVSNKMRSKVQVDFAQGSINLATFDQCQREIFKLMELNTYVPFLKSKFCQAYTEKKKLERSFLVKNMSGKNLPTFSSPKSKSAKEKRKNGDLKLEDV